MVLKNNQAHSTPTTCPLQLDLVVNHLENGKAVVLPTDTVAGLVAFQPALLYALKNRTTTKKIILFWPPNQPYPTKDFRFAKLANHFWPGALTIVFANQGYRLPNDPFLQTLLAKTGPLYATSANLSGHEPVTGWNGFQNQFHHAYDKVVFTNCAYPTNGTPSTVYNIESDCIVRNGTISYDTIHKILTG